MSDGSATAHLLLPKLVSTFIEGYDGASLRRDLVAGATVAIVALPLSMAIAVASGVSPDRGLVTAIIGGFFVSALSGSRFQIGGPAGAFITLIAATVAQVGIAGLVTAVFLSGALLAVLGLLRVGSLVRHIPHAVTVGFSAGIGLIIFASQLKDLCGLELRGPEPAALVAKLIALAQAAPSFNPAALALGVGTAAIIFPMRKYRPDWPSLLIALTAAAAIAALAHLPVETIATRFGGIPHMLPAPALPDLTPAMIMRVLPAALSFTMLGAVESLLSAKVADGMTGRKHRSNMELIGQGFANVATAFFGGICVTGTIARTATNVRAGAASPVSGMLHAAFLLVFMAIAAPLAGYVPLAALAGVLVTVCWNMVEKAEIARLLRAWPTALVLLSTLIVTLVEDLTMGIIAGCAVAALLAWLHRPVAEEDPGD